ncbi:MAG: hypothetical protein HZA14_09170 [Nitrospirae bacterium]|nr:hypothetical protein [Nitrospirota bacterium]
MIKKVLTVVILLSVIFQSAAFATEGEVVFRDTLYGTAIGAMVGAAVYLIDQDNFGEKVGAGVIIGTLGGLLYGLKETSSFVEIEKDKVIVSIPTPIIQKENHNVRYSASLLKTRF